MLYHLLVLLFPRLSIAVQWQIYASRYAQMSDGVCYLIRSLEQHRNQRILSSLHHTIDRSFPPAG